MDKNGKETVIVTTGWHVKLIPNPDYPSKSLNEFIEKITLEDEFIETWYWLVYQGSHPENPSKVEKNAWRSLKENEYKIIQDFIQKGKYSIIGSKKQKFKVVSGEKAQIEYIEIPISYIFRLNNGMIVKKWRSLEEDEF